MTNREIQKQILRKKTAIGYLLHTYYLGSLRKAVIATELKERNKNQEEGGTGKSLVGNALNKIHPVHYKGSRKKYLFDDKHILAGLSPAKKIIFFEYIYIFYIKYIVYRLVCYVIVKMLDTE